VQARAQRSGAGTLAVRPVRTARDRKRFVELQYSLYAGDPCWRAPLRSEVHDLIGGRKTNPWFEHGRAAYWLAERDGAVVGRISAQVDELVLKHMGAGLGQWGMFECIDDAEVADALFDAAEAWLRAQGMSRSAGPFSLSIWDEPGLLVEGARNPPTVMMGHHHPYYQRLVEARGYAGVKDLYTYELDIVPDMPPLVRRIMRSAERDPRIRLRNVDKSRFAEEAALILEILNDAWSENWGFIPLTPAEVEHVGKKLKPIVYEDLIRVAELDGEPVAFMITLPDVNELTRDLDGRLLPFGWAKLLWRLRRPRVTRMRVPLMGVRKVHQSSRLASQLAFMLIETTRQHAVTRYGATRAEIGWILDDNGPMRSIADAIGSRINNVYRIYERPL
jgi:hypothetical protein